MHFLLATGILPPDLGGPAVYVAHLAKHLRDLGHEITIVTYGNPTKIPNVRTLSVRRTGIRFLNLLYFICRVMKWGRGADVIMAFDIMSSGLPTMIASLFLGKRPFLRLGGDFFWERDMNEERVFCSLEEYYDRGGFKKGVAFPIAGAIMRRVAVLACSTTLLESMYVRAFPVLRGKTVVVENPYPDIGEVGPQSPREKADGPFLFVGRLVKLKNLSTLIGIFQELALEGQDAHLDIIGDGPEREALERLVSQKGLQKVVRIHPPVAHEEVLRRIPASRACVLPSLSEVSPNFALECLKLNTPLIITKYNGLPEIFRQHAVQIDPFDRHEIKGKIADFLRDEGLPNAKAGVNAAGFTRTWTDVAWEILHVVKGSAHEGCGG